MNSLLARVVQARLSPSRRRLIRLAGYGKGHVQFQGPGQIALLQYPCHDSLPIDGSRTHHLPPLRGPRPAAAHVIPHRPRLDGRLRPHRPARRPAPLARRGPAAVAVRPRPVLRAPLLLLRLHQGDRPRRPPRTADPSDALLVGLEVEIGPHRRAGRPRRRAADPPRRRLADVPRAPTSCAACGVADPPPSPSRPTPRSPSRSTRASRRASSWQVLRELGFNRVSLGVQDFDPGVQKAVNRIQPFEMVRADGRAGAARWGSARSTSTSSTACRSRPRRPWPPRSTARWSWRLIGSRSTGWRSSRRSSAGRTSSGAATCRPATCRWN